jgi:hypothetical protein
MLGDGVWVRSAGLVRGLVGAHERSAVRSVVISKIRIRAALSPRSPAGFVGPVTKLEVPEVHPPNVSISPRLVD